MIATIPLYPGRRSALKRLALCGFALLVAAPGSALPASAGQDGRDLVLFDGFEGTDFAPGGGLYYKDNHEQEAGSYAFESEIVRSGKQAIELSVRSQCKKQNGLCSERAEVWEKPEVLVLYGEPVWYALSMRMATPIPTEPHRYVMAQWKREIIPGAHGDYSPLLALRLVDGRLVATVDTDTGTFQPTGTAERPTACRPGEAPAGTPDEFGQFRTLVAAAPGEHAPAQIGFPGCSPDLVITPRGGTLPALDSGWIDFVFQVKPGPGGDGRIDIVANGQWIVTVEGKIGHEGDGLGEHMYFKFGPYRAGQDGIWKLWYDDFRRGPACTDVASAELCATLGAGVKSALTP
ncbi:hypothetical protein FHS55_003253 [Angulomicrobium tetraedrale]|uniref:Polysaccharide lyase-like protein n=1 Tax=Ancylobacter tetraedralis TaxID=217068 RepID=A0A839ZDB6_9HYPH|nr:polysaccharide lyase [Ancylobacter tetraedralis]MBB3772632.1 hypothetical protein [Ancylobacter tetraedralis]